MKKLLLTGVAALSLLNAVGVQTFTTTVELPDAMDHALAAAVLLALSTTAANAAGAEVPAQYRGMWCHTLKGPLYYYRCRKANSEGSFYIRPDRLYLGEPDSTTGDCRAISVRPSAKGHRVSVDCGRPTTGDKPVKGVNLWLDVRGHLHVD
jgi:hypothetical protein